MMTSITRIKQFTLAASAITFAVIPGPLLWASFSFELAPSETSREIIYEEFATVDGLVVPTRYSVYEKNHSLYATCEIRDWSFKKPFDAARMTMPPGAVIDASRRRTVMTESTNERSEQSPSAHPKQTCCPIVELRQYTLHPGKRDILIDLFDREFVESQEAVDMRVIGQFRDLDDPNRFVWLRGFRDMPSRAQALQAFYGGPVWKAHREVANATMIDSDNVLLLHRAHEESGFSLEKSDRPPLGADEVPKGLVVATIYYFDAPAGDDFVDFFNHVLKPVLTDAGAPILAYFVTESSVNSFPALPVREGENVFVWFSRFRDQVAYERHLAALARSQRWGGEISEELARRLKGHSEVLKLSPTARSQLR